MNRRFMTLGTSSAAVLGMAMHKAIMNETAAPPEEHKPMDLPDSHPDWRVNNAALAPIAANSPLETRQQRRAASKALARGLATTGKMKERENRILEKKRKRADEAAQRYLRIARHVPTESSY